MINVLYLGAFPPEFLIKRSKGEIDSLYRDSQTIIKGLRLNSDVKLKVITSPDLLSWPHGPLYINREVNENEHLTLVSSLNVRIIKQVWTIISLIRESRPFIKQSESQVVVLIPYMVFRHVFTLRILKLLYPKKVIQACVVPDIFFPHNRVKRLVNKMTERMASHFDAFVFYTRKMADHLKVSEGRYEVIEGFREVPERSPLTGEIFKVVYAGSLNINYGIVRLIDAFSLIKDNEIELHLYGEGSAVSIIRDVANHDKRIIYHGKVSNAEATNAIYSASVLINPRNSSDGAYTEYSFPSKDIEYMATGIPTLLCKLPGMPNEYYGKFIDLEDGSPEHIANSIEGVKNMSLDERTAFGDKARSFIKERMDSSLQTARIVALFNRIIILNQ